MLLKKCPGFFTRYPSPSPGPGATRRCLSQRRTSHGGAALFPLLYGRPEKRACFLLRRSAAQRHCSGPRCGLATTGRRDHPLGDQSIIAAAAGLYAAESIAKRRPMPWGLLNIRKEKDYYRFLVRVSDNSGYLTRRSPPNRVKAVEQSETRMAGLRQSLISGNTAGIHQYVRTDPRFFPKTPEEVGSPAELYLRRVEPIIPSYFSKVPTAPYGVRRLEPRLEGIAGPLGIINAPSAEEPMGIYYFNGRPPPICLCCLPGIWPCMNSCRDIISNEPAGREQSLP